MEIRTATESDIPDIVSLLKLSLGDSLMPKSERYWRWKHLENPFGPSPVLLCWEGGQLVGVRAFMRWEWIQQGQIYRAVRAVDTATHPAHQGKGIFKKLTLALVEYCNERGDHFVFNTPNKKSKPGYLKMGWEEAGKLPVNAGIHRPFSMLMHFAANSETSVQGVNNDDNIRYFLQHENLSTFISGHQQQSKELITNTTGRYLRWRYVDVPVAKYVAIGDEREERLTGLIIGRIKKSRLGRELRITDSFLPNEQNGKKLVKMLNEFRREWRIDYTTQSGTLGKNTQKLLTGLNVKTSMGPTVTVRSLFLKDLSMLRNFNHWSPALGDLELF